jgi:hypothetical protein
VTVIVVRLSSMKMARTLWLGNTMFSV